MEQAKDVVEQLDASESGLTKLDYFAVVLIDVLIIVSCFFGINYYKKIVDQVVLGCTLHELKHSFALWSIFVELLGILGVIVLEILEEVVGDAGRLQLLADGKQDLKEVLLVERVGRVDCELNNL